MFSLGFEPGAAEWWALADPLCYGGPKMSFSLTLVAGLLEAATDTTRYIFLLQ